MARRRTAKFKRLVAGGEPIACWCGSTRWKHELTMFPMAHVSRCLECERVVTCELQTSPPRPKPKPPEGPPFFDGWPPFFYP